MDGPHQTPTNESEEIETQHFFLQPELWRSAGWGIGGLILIAAIGISVDAFVMRRPPIQITRGVICSSGAVWLSQYLLSRVRVDSTGVSKRVMWWWSCWPWSAISDGRVQQGLDRHRFEFPGNPWWSRVIDLKNLDEQDRDFVGLLISHQLPPEIDQPVPDVVTFRMEWPDRREVDFNSAGVTIRKRSYATNYRWSELDATLWRADCKSLSFKEGQLVLPDQVLNLRRSGQIQNWLGANPIEIAGVLETRLGLPGLKQYAIEGDAQSMDELDARAERLKKRHRGLRPMARWSPRIMWCTTASAPFWLPWPNGLVMAVGLGLLSWAMQWCWHETVNEVTKREAAIEEQRSKLQAQL